MINALKIIGTGLALMVFAFVAGYIDGVKAGTNKAKLALEREAHVASIAVRETQARIDRQTATAAETETKRQIVVKEIRREMERIVERPVYRTVCVDADGVRLLDQAADISNGTWANAKPATNLPAPPDPAAGVAESASPQQHMNGTDCVQSMVDLYDTAGQIRAQLIALQSQVILSQVGLTSGAAPE